MDNPQTQSEFLVAPIFPANDIHLIFGPSGAGKTTLALQLSEALTTGEAVFGRPATAPTKVAYVSCMRSNHTTIIHARRISIDPSILSPISLGDRADEGAGRSLPEVLEQVQRRCGHAVRVIILDGIASICPKINDFRSVSEMLNQGRAFCESRKLTLFGCVSSAKSREGERYTSPRDRAIGSTAWMESTETKLLIEPLRPSIVTDPYRHVVLMPQGCPPEQYYYRFSPDGKLLPTNPQEAESGLDRWLMELAPGYLFRTGEVAEAARALGLSRATAYRWMEEKLALGEIKKVEHGVYQIEGGTHDRSCIYTN